MSPKWDVRFMEIAAIVGSWSKDLSASVGCVVADSSRIIRATGYNGRPRGIRDLPLAPEREERPEKYLWVEHAERNALYVSARIGVTLSGCVMYVTHMPCADCARGIVQAGLTEVVIPASRAEVPERWRRHAEIARQLLSEGSVELREIGWTP